MKKLKKQITHLLKIQAPSGKEYPVIAYVKPILEALCDKVWLDSYNNLLAEKKVGTGTGATVILSAHMDTVNRIQPDREILFDTENGIFYSTKGILGGDDRAGIAIILAVLRNIEKTGFDGTIKVAFSREEEIGCVGASKIDPTWIAGSDLAIVVDRRGNSDIVVGTFGQPFCSDAVGEFLEECGAMQDANWKATQGGISDATIFSELGVNSVNLSAGYQNEHTDKEFLVLSDMKKTVNLILQALTLVNDFAHSFGEVPNHEEGNKWIDGYFYGYQSYYNDYRYADAYDGLYDDVFFEAKDKYGKVSATIYGDTVFIGQGDFDDFQEILIKKSTFEKLILAYSDVVHRRSKNNNVNKSKGVV